MIYQREATKRIRIGVVGVGSHCYRNILPTLPYLPVELVAVADPDFDRAKITGQQFGACAYKSASEMYDAESLDAVLLAVSPQHHPPLAIEAFAAGLHVWLEKPVAVRSGQVEEMIAARKDRVCVIGLKKAFMPATAKVLEILASSSTSALRTATGTYPMDVPENGAAVLEDAKTSNKWLLDGCHPLALLIAVGGAVREVTVLRSRLGGGFCVLGHENGAVSSLHLAEGVPRFQPYERYLFVTGGESIQIENTRKVIYQRGIEFNYSTGTSFAPPGMNSGATVWEAQDGYNTLENKAVFTQGLYGALEHFCESVLNSRVPTKGTLEFALAVSRTYEAALLSNGKTVAVAR